MATSPRDRLRGLAAHLEAETPAARAELIATRAIAGAERRVAGRLRSFALRLEAGTHTGMAERIAVRAVATGSERSPRYVLRRIAAVTAAAATLSIGAIGVGAIANQASPGDLLYGMDRVYESAAHVFGARTDHTEERLTEALALIDKGRSADAVALVDEAVKDYSAQHGLTDLEKAYADARVARTVVTTTTSPSTPTTMTAAPPTTIVAAPEDPVVVLRLAVEMLLRNVQAVDSQAATAVAVADSALQAAVAASSVEDQVALIAAGSTTSTTEVEPGITITAVTDTTHDAPTSSLPDEGSATTLTMPTDTTPPTVPSGGTTSTTAPLSTSTTAPLSTSTTTTSATSTTTVPDGSTTTVPSSTSTTTTTGAGGGGIILPPLP